MAIKPSKAYEVDGNKYSFAFDGDKLVGVNKVDASGDVVSNADLNASIFQTDAVKESITEAYNVNRSGGNTDDYVDDFSKVEQSTDSEKASYSNFQKKKYDNQQYEDQVLEGGAVAQQDQERFYNYAGYTKPTTSSDIMKYPQDMDVNQDHFKIMKYNYQRRDVNASKPRSCLLYTSPSPRDLSTSRMPSSA